MKIESEENFLRRIREDLCEIYELLIADNTPEEKMIYLAWDLGNVSQLIEERRRLIGEGDEEEC